MTRLDPSHFYVRAPMESPGAAPGVSRYHASRRSDVATPRRFVTESHSLGASAATPQSVLVAAVIAVAIYLIGRRLSA